MAAEAEERKAERERQAAQDAINADRAKAEAEQRKAERERQMAKLEAEAKERAEVAKEQARIDALPVNVLKLAYARYAYVKLCYDSREDYFLTYIKDVELERAKTAIKSIEAKATKDDPKIDTGEVWKQGLELSKKWPSPLGVPYSGDYGFGSICQVSLQTLLAASPKEVYPIEKP
jgi:hypothetical protein